MSNKSNYIKKTKKVIVKTTEKNGVVYLDEKIKGQGFSQIPEWLERNIVLSPGAKLVYGRLYRHGGDHKGEKFCAFVTHKKLGEELGTSPRTCYEYIQELIEFPLIEKVQRGNRRSNKYYFLSHKIISDYVLGTMSDTVDTTPADAEPLDDDEPFSL